MGVQVELHLHLEGTLEPELLMKLAAKNKVPLGFGGFNSCESGWHGFGSLSFFILAFASYLSETPSSEFFSLWCWL